MSSDLALSDVHRALADGREDRPVERPDVEFCVYAALEQRVAGETSIHHAAPLDGLDNVGVALPSGAAGVWPTTGDTLNYASVAAEASGPVDAVPTARRRCSAASPRPPGARWLDWTALGVRYPRVQNRPDAVER